jgi:hypothetical protein
VVVYIAIFVIAVLGVTVYAMHLRMQSENARIHRAYYAASALKLAEACEAEAFAWLKAQFALPWRLQHPFLQRLYTERTEQFSIPSGEEPDSPDHRYLDLLEADALLNSAALAEALQGRATIHRATVCLMDFQPIQVPDAGTFDATTQARAVVDEFERFGTLQFEVHVGYGKVLRGTLRGEDLVKKYTSRRDIKVVNLLPPVVSRFTLFARGFRGPGDLKEPYNAGRAGNEKHRAWVGETDFSHSQPLVLVHHPDDIKERRGAAGSHADIARYLPHEEPFDQRRLESQVLTEGEVGYRPDLQDRGWVYLGGEQPWVLNLQAGRANPGAKIHKTGFGVVPALTSEGHLFHETYLTISDDQLREAPGMEGWSPEGSTYGWRFSIWADGMPAGALKKEVYSSGYFANYLRRREFRRDSLYPSLFRLYGDIQSFDVDDAGQPMRYIDRRSPTLVFGPVLRRFTNFGYVSQMDREDREAVDAGTFPYDEDGRPVYPYDNPGGSDPRMRAIPYFHITRDGYDRDQAKFRLWGKWIWKDGIPPPDLAEVDETEPGTSRTGPIDYPTRKWRINSHALKWEGEPNWEMLNLLITRPRVQHYHDGYDWLVENARPVSFDPKRHLEQDNLPSLEPFEGEVSDSRFFYGTSDPDSDHCFFARNLRLHQFDPRADPPDSRPASSSFPEGFFHGSLDAVSLYDTSQAAPDPTTSARLSPARYDIRIKTTFSFLDEEEFQSSLMPGGDGVLRESPGITVIREGGLDLSEYPEVVFGRGGMIIVDGPIRLPRVVKSPAARQLGEVLSFVSLSSDITLAGNLVEASLVALGESRTVKREADDVTIRGNLVVDQLDFRTGGAGLFSRRRNDLAGLRPTGTEGLEAYPRNVLEYDPAMNPASLENYRDKYRAFMSGGISFWGVTE